MWVIGVVILVMVVVAIGAVIVSGSVKNKDVGFPESRHGRKRGL